MRWAKVLLGEFVLMNFILSLHLWQIRSLCPIVDFFPTPQNLPSAWLEFHNWFAGTFQYVCAVGTQTAEATLLQSSCLGQQQSAVKTIYGLFRKLIMER